MIPATILVDIEAERIHQDELWGVRNHCPDHWLVILGEEKGEACKASLECSLLHYREELIDIAAVAIAAIECLDRDNWR